MDADNVRPLDSAPSARAEQQHAEAAYTAVVERITEQLRRHQWAKVPVNDDEERAYITKAAPVPPPSNST